MTKKLRTLVLAGGGSAEREVSLHSGRAVFEGLSRLGHSVSALDPASGASLLGAGGKYIGSSVVSEAAAGNLPAVNERALLDSLEALRVDVVFLALHGGEGENGVMQTLLDLAGVAYTGSGRAASTVAMDKPLTKRIARSLGLETPRWIRINRAQFAEDPAVVQDKILAELQLPLIIKPAEGGSTVGLTLVKEEGSLAPACEKALEDNGRALAEEYAPGREMTVAVFDGESWPVVEIRPKEGLYDYQAKYTSGGSEYFCPADIDAESAEVMQSQARAVYEALGCDGLARVDFILPESGQPQLLELNTIPGMTELSLAPMAAKQAGISFDELLQKMLDSALAGR